MRNPLLAAALAQDPEWGRWNYHKRQSRQLERQLNAAGLAQLAYRVGWCSETLVYAPPAAGAGDELGRGRLLERNGCHVRVCPVCQVNRSSEWAGKVKTALPAIVAELGPDWGHVTLTVKNRPLEELRKTIGELHKALARLLKRKEFQAVGWLRNTEVTINPETGEAHPHIHLLVAFPPRYFETKTRKVRRPEGGRPRILPGYMTHAKLVQLWQESARLAYAPTVHIQKVDLSTEKGAAVLYEVTKYGMKPADRAQLPADRLPLLLEQIAGVRGVGVGGELRRFLRPPLDWDPAAPWLETQTPHRGPRLIGSAVQWDGAARRYRERIISAPELVNIAAGQFGYELVHRGPRRQVIPLPSPELGPAPPFPFGDAWLAELGSFDDPAELRRLRELAALRPPIVFHRVR